MQSLAGGTPFLPHTTHCAVHPDRAGAGICVRCRSVVCLECTTPIDGINYCTRCLDAAAGQLRAKAFVRPPSRRREALLAVPLLLVCLGLCALVFFGLAYGLALWRSSMPGGLTPEG